jgi:hypothetical protein
MGWVVNATPRPLYPPERPGTHCIGGWVGPRSGLDRCGKSRLHRNSIPGPSSPQQVAIPTALSRPSVKISSVSQNVWGGGRFTAALLHCCPDIKMAPIVSFHVKRADMTSRIQHRRQVCNCRHVNNISCIFIRMFMTTYRPIKFQLHSSSCS